MPYMPVPYVIEQTHRGERTYDIYQPAAEGPHHLSGHGD